jgi:hypothetical protein
MPMSDDKTKKDYHDRDRVSGSEDYEVRYFADRHGLEPDQVRDLIRRHGNDRETLDREAARLTRA